MGTLVAGSGGRTPAQAVGIAGDRIGRLPSSDAAARKADSDPPGLPV
jgi:hypothetical protein